MAVFLDGCYWHGCPDHFIPPKSNVEYWLPKIERNRQRDAEVDAALAERAWTVVRVWEHEPVAEASERVAQEVRAALARAGLR